MYRFTRKDRHEAIFARMRENGEKKTMMYLYGDEIHQYIRAHYVVIPKTVHPQKPQLFLCEVTLPKEG